MIYIVPFCGTMFFSAFALKKKIKNRVVIQLENYLGDSILTLDSVTYRNALGQPFSVSMFKYYISNIRFKGRNGNDYVNDQYFLVNEDDGASKTITLNDVLDNAYTSISFILGVDSAHNCRGVQRGALDPLNGMFWAWNTGYIFLKLEGHSPASTSTGNIVEYHIGGYKEPNNCIRTISLSFGDNLFITRSTEKPLYTIKIKANVAEVLKNPAAINFSKLSSVTDFHNSTTIADNYKDMFSILKVE